MRQCRKIAHFYVNWESVSVSRKELKLLWLERVSQARERYVFKTEICKMLMAERAVTFPNILPSYPDGTLALHHALQRESEALHEYMRVLRIYTDLVTFGKMPPTDE